MYIYIYIYIQYMFIYMCVCVCVYTYACIYAEVYVGCRQKGLTSGLTLNSDDQK